jgi:PIN domain nuclease of toxin-antitoxin system
MKYILDTHALIWFLEGNSRLGVTAKEILSDSSSELILPAIAFDSPTMTASLRARVRPV